MNKFRALIYRYLEDIARGLYLSVGKFRHLHHAHHVIYGEIITMAYRSCGWLTLIAHIH